MKTKVFGFVVVACLVCAGLASCAAGEEDYTANFVGAWELTSMEGGESSLTADEFAMMKEMGVSASLNLAEDSTYIFDLFGDQVEGAWEATAADAASLAVSGQTIPITLVGDTLQLTQSGDQTLIFTHASAALGNAASSDDAATGSADTADTEDTEDTGETADDEGTEEGTEETE